MNLSKHVVQGFIARAAAILTNGAVGTTPFNVNQTLDGRVSVFVDFTLGSLTNVIIQPQVHDGTNWYDVTSPGSLTLTADGKKEFVVDCKGAKQFRCTLIGTGTVTSSSAAVKLGWQTAGGVTG